MAARYLLLLLFVCNFALADDRYRSRYLKEIGSETDIKLVGYGERGTQFSRFGRPRLEYTVGLLYSDYDYRGFVSIGPVWHHISESRRGVFIQEISFAPTVLSGGKFHGKDMGGIMQFTTGLSLGWKPRLNSSVHIGLRLQHISNGSIHIHNPGMDSLGLELTWTPR